MMRRHVSGLICGIGLALAVATAPLSSAAAAPLILMTRRLPTP